MKKLVLLILLFVLLPVPLGILAYEIYVRAQIAERIPAHIDSMIVWVQNQPLTTSMVDALLGREVEMIPNGLFKINQTLDFGAFADGKAVLDFSVRTNNLGLLSDLDVDLSKTNDPETFRILVFGDSLTGTTTANYQWVDTVQEILNSDARLAASIGKKRFRVYNLGWVAAGFANFWHAFDRVGRQLNGDLLILNFVYDDFRRDDERPRFSDEDLMVENAVKYLENFKSTGIPLIVTQMPIYPEIFPMKHEFPLTERVKEALPDITIHDMRETLPISRGQDFVKIWYNLPYDHHMSDFGGEIYARTLSELIAKRVTGGAAWTFMNTPSEHFTPSICLADETEADSIDQSETGVRSTPTSRNLSAICANRPRARTAVRKVLDNPENIARLRSGVLERMRKAKIWTASPWFIDTALRNTDPLIPNVQVPLTGGFEKTRYGDAPDEFAYLNIFCTAGTPSLSNPKCYTYMHFYVK